MGVRIHLYELNVFFLTFARGLLFFMCRMKAVASASTEQQYVEAVEELKSSPVWQKSETLRKWFTRVWLSYPKVPVMSTEIFQVEAVRVQLQSLLFHHWDLT